MRSIPSTTRRWPQRYGRHQAAESSFRFEPPEVSIFHRFLRGAGVAAALTLLAVPLSGQQVSAAGEAWHLRGLRHGFCILLLMDPAVASRRVPAGLRLRTAGESKDLHPALAAALKEQPTLGGWSPSHLCFYAVDTVEAEHFSLEDKSGRKPQIFALWTVSAEQPTGDRRDVALMLLASSDRLIRSGRLAGQTIREIRAKLGKVTEVDLEGRTSGDDRFQMKIGKTLLTWDGHQAADSSEATGTVDVRWAASATAAEQGGGTLTLTPERASPMVGSLKVEGKDELATALRQSPVRFVGPMYRGGAGEVTLQR